MQVVSTTLCYPHPACPMQGIFVWRRLREVGRLVPLTVVSPVPWFPGWRGEPNAEGEGCTRRPLLPCIPRRFRKGLSRRNPQSEIHDPQSPSIHPPSTVGGSLAAASPRCETESAEWDHVPPVVRPRMFYLPGVLKRLDAMFYARAFRAGLAMARGQKQAGVLSCAGGQQGGGLCYPGGGVVIDAHFEWPDGVGAWRVAREERLPFICTLRGKLVSQIRHAAKRRMIREMLLGADALIAVSRSLAELACEAAGRDLGVRVIPNGVDGGLFHRWASSSPVSPSAEARAVCGWESDAKYVVSVGHLQALKGFHLLVDVWPEVRRRVGDVRLILVGGPAGEPAYEKGLRRLIESACTDSVACGTAVSAVGTQAGRPCHSAGGTQAGRPCHSAGGTQARRLCHRPIVLAGRVPPERVAMVLNAADLFVLASRSEGWCNAIAEALACGCPVVATDVGGNREIVSESGLGRLVPWGEREALVEGICRGLAAEWDRDRIALVGGRRDWQQVARECVDVFAAVSGRARETANSE